HMPWLGTMLADDVDEMSVPGVLAFARRDSSVGRFEPTVANERGNRSARFELARRLSGPGPQFVCDFSAERLLVEVDVGRAVLLPEEVVSLPRDEEIRLRIDSAIGILDADDHRFPSLV